MIWMFVLACMKPAMLADSAVVDGATALLTEIQQHHRSPCENEIHFAGSDRWSSTLMRWFTPLKSNKENFVANQDVLGTFKHLELTNGTVLTYRSQAQQWTSSTGLQVSAKERIYAESLILYLQLPTFSMKVFNPQKLSPQTIAGKHYERLFFMLQNGSVDDVQLDHFVAYWNPQSKHIDYVVFTYRDLFASYKGVLQLAAYEKHEGISYPRKLRIQNGFLDTKDVHQIEIQRIECR